MAQSNSPLFIDPANNPLPQVFYQPEADVPESKKDNDWYIRNNRFITSFYNQLLPQFNIPGGASESVLERRTVAEILRNFAYYKGQQPNVDFKAHTMTMNNDLIPAVWISGSELSGLITFAVNVMDEAIENIEWSSKSLSDETAQMWEDMNNKIRYMIDARDSLKALQSVGIAYKPTEEDIEDHDDADAFMDKWKSESELTAIEIADAIYESTFSKNVYLKAFLHAIVGAIGSVYTYVENGEVKKQHKASYSVIYDNRDDDFYNRQAQFCGFVDRYTPTEIYLKYPELGADPKARAEIQAMAERNDGYQEYMNYWNGGVQNLSWWGYEQNRMTVAVSTTFWIGIQDTRLVKGNNSLGNELYQKIKDEKVQGDYWVPIIYQSTIVGNKWLVEKGPMDNMVRDYRNKSNPMLPLRNYLPEMELGYPRSLTSRAVNNQNEMDRLKYKIQELTANDLGKNYIINSHKLPDGTTAKDLISAFKTMHVFVGEPSGENDEQTSKEQTVETVDMSNNSDISQYIALYHEQERIQQRIFNYNDVVMGQQRSTIGKGVQEQTIAQAATGTLGLYSGFMEFIRLDMQYSTNLWKLVNAKTNEASSTLVVGKDGMKVIRMSENFRWEDMLIFIEPNDNLDKESKARTQQLFFAQAQNNRIDAIDYIDGVEFAKGKRDMVKKLKQSRKRTEKKAMEMQEGQIQQEQMMEQNKALAAQNNLIIQQTAQLMADFQKINLTGSWKVRDTEVKNAGAIQNKEADAVIQHSIMEVDQAHEAAMKASDQAQEHAVQDKEHAQEQTIQEMQPAPATSA